VPIRLLLRPNHNCADTPTVPPTVRSCRYACDPQLPLTSYCYNKRLYYPATVNKTMIVPLRLQLRNQLIARALRLTYYHKITDRRAPYSTAIVTAASTVLLPKHSCSCLQLNLNLTTTTPACSTTINFCCYARSTTNDPRCSACSISSTTTTPPPANTYNGTRGRRQAPKDKA